MFPKIYSNVTENVTIIITLDPRNSDVDSARARSTVDQEAIMETLFGFLAAARRVRVGMAKSLERLGVTPAEYELLARSRAGAWSGVHDVPNDLLERLVIKGLIRRIGSEASGVRVARITHAGRNLLEQCDHQIDAVRAGFAASFTADERTALTEFLGKIP
jgi:hypothetical protein